ncbi:MAG: hypothetical protein AAFQ87_04720, partial [Bacteroidota bacterium]
MHDGRFATLREVIQFYNHDIQPHPNLDPLLLDDGGQPIRLNLTKAEVLALEEFLHTLTDESFLTDDRWSEVLDSFWGLLRKTSGSCSCKALPCSYDKSVPRSGSLKKNQVQSRVSRPVPIVGERHNSPPYEKSYRRFFIRHSIASDR